MPTSLRVREESAVQTDVCPVLAGKLQACHLLQQAKIGAFQISSTGQFIAANSVLARLLGFHSLQDFLHAGNTNAAHIFVQPEHWQTITQLLREKRKPIKVKSYWKCRDGSHMTVRLQVWGKWDDQQCLFCFEGIIEDITRRAQREEDLAKREAYLTALVKIQHHLITNTGENLPHRNILKELANVAHASRIMLYETLRGSDGHFSIYQRAVWDEEGRGCLGEGLPGNEDTGITLPERWFEVLKRGESLDGVQQDFQQSERDFLKSQKIQAILLIPFIANRDFLGFLRFDNCQTATSWSSLEIPLLKTVAASLALAREQLLARQHIQLQDTRIELQQTEIHRQQSEIFRQAEDLKQTNRELRKTLEHLEATQQSLIHSEKMAALGQLVAGIAHEINTPLGAIRSSIGNISQVLGQTLEGLPEFFQNLSQERASDFFTLLHAALKKDLSSTLGKRSDIRKTLTTFLEKNQIKRARHTANMLVDMGVHNEVDLFFPLLCEPDHLRILTFAYHLSGVLESAHIIETAIERASKVMFALKMYARKDETNSLVNVNFIERFEAVLTIYYHQLKHGVEVFRDYHGPQELFCYPDELDQVWVNLIHNALQAMKFQGSLTIVIRSDPHQVCVSITDTGKGIPPEIQSKIFEPFFTTKPAGEGIGLGLEIVKNVVEKHQGQIHVASRPGKTTFDVILPRIHPS